MKQYGNDFKLDIDFINLKYNIRYHVRKLDSLFNIWLFKNLLEHHYIDSISVTTGKSILRFSIFCVEENIKNINYDNETSVLSADFLSLKKEDYTKRLDMVKLITDLKITKYFKNVEFTYFYE